MNHMIKIRKNLFCFASEFQKKGTILEETGTDNHYNRWLLRDGLSIKKGR